MSPRVQIRTIYPQDATEIERLYQQSAEHLKSLGDSSQFLFNAQHYLQHGFGEKPTFSGIIAEVNQTPVGYLLYSFFYDTDNVTNVMFVLDLLVDQHHRQQGIGKALMVKAKTIAKDQGAKDLFWAVYKDNRLAETFYTKLGAKQVSDVFFMTMSSDETSG